MRLPFRFIISTVAGLTAFTAVPLAAKNMDMVDVSGHARTRFIFQDNAALTETNNTEGLVNRVRLNVDVTPTKSLQVRITPEFTNTWGTATPADGAFTAHEAWMSWAPNSAWTVFLGRQVLAYGRGLIIGANDWTNVARNFDAARARYSHQWGTTDLFYAKIDERSTAVAPAVTGGDHGLWGMYNALNPKMPTVKGLDLYVLFDDERGAGVRSRIGVLGARVEGDVQAVDYNLEMTGQYGKAAGTTQKGFMTDLELGTKVMEKHRVALAFDYGNSEWTELFPETHKYLGMSDVIATRANLIALALLTKWALNNAWSLGLDGHYFMQAKDDLGTAGGLVTTGDRAMGMEGDVTIGYKPEERLAFEVGYDVFKPLSALEDAGLNKTSHTFYLQSTLSF